MLRKSMEVIAKAAMETAKKGTHSASFFGFYQPKEPKQMRKSYSAK